MTRVTWASLWTSNPMGQQHYEQEIQRALRSAATAEWTFEALTVASARSHAAGAKRVPSRVCDVAPLVLSRSIGRMLYGSPELVHRFDLRVPSAWGREVVTVHDLPPLRFPDEGRLTRSTASGARRAIRVIVPSRFAAAELEELLGIKNAEVIPHGLSAHCVGTVEATDDELRMRRITTPFLLHAAGATKRKNLSGLADAWQIIGGRYPDLKLVLCGAPDPRRDNLFASAARVVRAGRLEASTVAGLMRRATAVVVPSIYEGFGLPALEGMACGAPVVAARRGALPEVCGEASLLVEPDGESIAEGIERVLTDKSLADDLRKRGLERASEFDWSRAARAHLRVYEAALR